MYNGVKYFAVFSLGAAIGSIAAWKILKTKYEQLANEEIEEVREYYSNKYNADVEPDFDQEDVSEFTNKVSELGYGDFDQEGGSDVMKRPEPDVTASEYVDAAPYVISPEEFAADDEYQTESLTYYACGTLTDDFDNPIEDINAMVGDALSHFGEYEDDSVFVRNDRYKCNYEILKDVRSFADVKNRALNLADEDE